MLSKTKPAKTINIFYCYARRDKKLRDTLADHLSNLRWQGLITEWHDFDISPGLEWEEEIAQHLDDADIILLLITSNFMASYYCHEVEMKRAIERHNAREARVIPILLRDVDWENAPFSKLQALPTNGKPISRWQRKDEAYLDVCEGIKRVVNRFLGIPERSLTKQAERKTPSPASNGSSARHGQTATVSRQRRKLPPLRYTPTFGDRLHDFFA